MRHISYAMTKRQFRDRSKTITRRMGWLKVKPGDLLMGCEKCMGFKPGETVQRLGIHIVVSARRERLDAIDQDDVDREGFPEMTPDEFVEMFRRASGCEASTEVTRIEFLHIPGGRF